MSLLAAPGALMYKIGFNRTRSTKGEMKWLRRSRQSPPAPTRYALRRPSSALATNRPETHTVVAFGRPLTPDFELRVDLSVQLADRARAGPRAPSRFGDVFDSSDAHTSKT
jgi:hypothetical protein